MDRLYKSGVAGSVFTSVCVCCCIVLGIIFLSTVVLVPLAPIPFIVALLCCSSCMSFVSASIFLEPSPEKKKEGFDIVGDLQNSINNIRQKVKEAL